MKRREEYRCSVLTSADPDYRLQAAQVIKAGGVVALPTETCFGLAVDPFNPAALERLFTVKKRPRRKPVLVLVHSRDDLTKLVRRIPRQYEFLMQSHWPGPLTLIFPALPNLPALLTGGSDSIGIRISSHPEATEICRLAGGIITATSANISEQQPAHSVEEILAAIGTDIDLVVSSESIAAGDCSTIVAEKEGALVLIRSGRISFADLVPQVKRQ